MPQTQTALRNTGRYSVYAMAREASSRQVYKTRVLLGDDGRYWVPSTHREAGILMRAGYEAADGR